MLLGVNAFAFGYGGDEPRSAASEPTESFQSAFDAHFRQSCAKSFKQNYSAEGVPAPVLLTEQYCECALSTFKETGSETIAAQTCVQRAKEGPLDEPSQEVDALYSGDIPHKRQARGRSTPLRVFASVFGSVSAIVVGVTSFVGGLLGWLLVMKKRVLQCDVCGAVVNAS